MVILDNQICIMFFAIFEGTYNVIIGLGNIRITNSALGVPIEEPLGPFGPSGLSLAPLGRHSHALFLRHYNHTLFYLNFF